MHKIEFVITARPSWSRVSTLINACIDEIGQNQVRVTTLGPAGSRRFGDIRNQVPKNIVFRHHDTLLESDSLSAVALSALEGGRALAAQWNENRPESVLVVADRTETLGVSLTASLMQIPLIHLQGGEISGSIDDKIRGANSKLADLHLTTNQDSFLALLGLGEPAERIHIIGCPSLDIVKNVLHQETSHFEQTLSLVNRTGVGIDLEADRDFGIIMFHPDTLNSSENLLWTEAIINLVEMSGINWLWLWPNSDFGNSTIAAQIRRSRENGFLTRCRMVINVPPTDFVELANRALVLVGNSSFGIRESSYLGLPVLNIGLRQANRIRANNVKDVFKPEELNPSVLPNNFFRYPSSALYGEGDAGRRGAEIIKLWVPTLKQRLGN